MEDVTARGDLIERSIVVYLAPIKETERLEEARFWPDFEKAKPRILGALLDAMVSALECVENVHPSRLPRMADFTRWAVSCERGLGFSSGTFINAYEKIGVTQTFSRSRPRPWSTRSLTS
jgi:hypothetical protein